MISKQPFKLAPNHDLPTTFSVHILKQPQTMSQSASRLIEPPPEMLTILRRTAEYVATRGDSFEKKLLEDQKNNPQFEFLQPSSKYFSYYRYILHIEVVNRGFSILFFGFSNAPSSQRKNWTSNR